MDRSVKGAFAALCALGVSAWVTAPASAQTAEVKEKPAMYSYVADWAIPRAQWGEMEKQNAVDQKNMEQAFADGSIVAFGADTSMVHQSDGMTHDSWWSSMSMAGLMKVLEQEYKSGNATATVLTTATKHTDAIFVSRYYNWHSGTFKDVYTRVAVFKLKADAPNDAIDVITKNVFAPVMEKLLAGGAIHEYEIDTESIHTEAPGTLWVVVIAANAAGLDKFNEAIQDLGKSSPLSGPALGSMIDFTAHRDTLSRTTARFK
jgi:hypothetical protein